MTSTVAYKVLIPPFLCELAIPPGTPTNQERDNVFDPAFAKFRCARAFVKRIWNLYTNQEVTEATSFWEPDFIYRVGEMVQPSEPYCSDIKLVCASGIHYFLSLEAAIAYSRPNFANQNSNFNGLIKWYHSNGRVSQEEFYKDGVLHGRAVSYHENGHIEEEKEYVDGTLEGIVRVYLENGTLRQEITYQNGTRHREFRSYHANGQIQEKRTYVDGKLCGIIFLWNKFGQLQEETEYLDNIRHGFQKKYYENGQPKFHWNYRHGLLHGKQISYHENGTVADSCKYRDGKFTKTYSFV